MSMIGAPEPLDELEARYQREAFRDLSYEDALRRFTALWVWAREIDPEFGTDWRNDLEPDLSIARVLNDLPRDA